LSKQKTLAAKNELVQTQKELEELVKKVQQTQEENERLREKINLEKEMQAMPTDFKESVVHGAPL
jgi:hypothetical protein